VHVHTGTNLFTPARAVYAVIILCVSHGAPGTNRLTTSLFCLLFNIGIYIARGCDPTKSHKVHRAFFSVGRGFFLVRYLNILCVVRSSRGFVNIRRFQSSWQYLKMDNLSTHLSIHRRRSAIPVTRYQM